VVESECQLTYSTFRGFVECGDRLASHCVNGDRYVKQVATENPCFTREFSLLFLCDHCLAFWWECVEHREHAVWEAAALFRDLRNPILQSELREEHAHLD
jgi:hypothetical protein